jgi:dihydropteroate synthase
VALRPVHYNRGMRRPAYVWKLRSRQLELGARTWIMGVLNVTPDSFYDGGRYLERDAAVEHAAQLLEEGADFIDVGGESTRPGARVLAGVGTPSRSSASGETSPSVASKRSAVTEEEELRRVVPVIACIKHAYPDAIISVDTYKATVARAAIEAGAEIVNDVSALRWDPEMARIVAQLDCGAVLMHMRGRPEDWHKLPPPENIVATVCDELKEWSAGATRAGVARERLVLDPGFGFGKSFEENYPLLARFEELHRLGFPLLAGTSRKSFVGRLLRQNGKDAPPEDRLLGTVATETAVILKGAHIIRAHDVRAAVDAARVADAILSAEAHA